MMSIALAAFLSLSASLPLTAWPIPQEQAVNANAQTLQTFKARLDKYMELHRRLAKAAPAPKQTENQAHIQASSDSLATGIRRERANAKQGEFFTPDVASLFRRLMYPETKGEQGAETKKALKEDAPAPEAIPFKVNARYPESESLPSVPPNLLRDLPRLPQELEYRIIGRHLILRDVPANLIVDYLPNAVRLTSDPPPKE